MALSTYYNANYLLEFARILFTPLTDQSENHPYRITELSDFFLLAYCSLYFLANPDVTLARHTVQLISK